MSVNQDSMQLVEAKRQTLQQDNMMDCFTEFVVPHLYNVRQMTDESLDNSPYISESIMNGHCDVQMYDFSGNRCHPLDPKVQEMGKLVNKYKDGGLKRTQSSFLFTSLKRTCKRLAQKVSLGNNDKLSDYDPSSFIVQTMDK
uniref:Uncharacterized protein n=1 Tax=Clandestinovirus TaxID=2831644 RepID=A0A8F8KLS9_9VIRU|nr:hypothetical protein KOM_12_208 [Clandestinovirus]